MSCAAEGDEVEGEVNVTGEVMPSLLFFALLVFSSSSGITGARVFVLTSISDDCD